VGVPPNIDLTKLAAKEEESGSVAGAFNRVVTLEDDNSVKASATESDDGCQKAVTEEDFQG
jgi:hypothetical protein